MVLNIGNSLQKNRNAIGPRHGDEKSEFSGGGAKKGGYPRSGKGTPYPPHPHTNE
jgi:hypothetical protein